MGKASERTKHMIPSGIRKVMSRAIGLPDVISFAPGEPDFTAHPLAVEAANKANLEGRTKYTHNQGIVELREKISVSLRKRGLNYAPDTEIVASVGAAEALLLVMLAVVNPGDEVIFPEPCFPNAIEQAKIVGGIPLLVPVLERDGFVYNPVNVRKDITPKTKLLYLNSPNNPTGSVTPLEVLKQLAEIVIENDIYVLADEVYKNYVYDGAIHHSIASLPGMKERTFVIDSFSKTYAMTGWRIGFTAGPKEIISEIVKLRETTTSSINSSAQYGALAALDLGDSEIEKMRQAYDARRKLMVEGLNSIPNISCLNPKGAFYVFANISKTGLTSEEFAFRLLDSKQVAVVPGPAFGEAGEGFVRLSYATSDKNIIEGIKRINTFVKSL